MEQRHGQEGARRGQYDLVKGQDRVRDQRLLDGVAARRGKERAQQ